MTGGPRSSASPIGVESAGGWPISGHCPHLSPADHEDCINTRGRLAAIDGNLPHIEEAGLDL